jgi:two-component system sensor histidine kinase KdpD
MSYSNHSNSRRGKLKVFLGFAPGVGKTYTMLEKAHLALADGVDLAVGYVETHNREDTISLLNGLEIIPRKTIAYRGLVLEEIDMEAILVRKPELVLVDELAHSNVPSSKNSKRHEDITELLQNGIDVYTTVNIQHIDILHDVIYTVTKVSVNEIVPSSFITEADEIELVDLPVTDLRQRLIDGKIYKANMTLKALENFFSEGNLDALRELSLLYTAKQVDDDLISYMKRNKIEGPWPVRERVMLCIEDPATQLDSIRLCARTADQNDWVAAYIRYHDEDKSAVQAAKTLSRELDGINIDIVQEDIVGNIIKIAKEHNVTRIMIAKPPRKWYNLFYPSIAEQLIEKSSNIEISILPHE